MCAGDGSRLSASRLTCPIDLREQTNSHGIGGGSSEQLAHHRMAQTFHGRNADSLQGSNGAIGISPYNASQNLKLRGIKTPNQASGARLLAHRAKSLPAVQSSPARFMLVTELPAMMRWSINSTSSSRA